MDTGGSAALPRRLRPPPDLRWAAGWVTWIVLVTAALSTPYGRVRDRLDELLVQHRTVWGEVPSSDDRSYRAVQVHDPPELRVDWPALRPNGVACLAEVWIWGGRARAVRVGGCHADLADPVHAAVSEVGWPDHGVYRTSVVARAPRAPLAALGRPEPWLVAWMLAVGIPPLLARALGSRRTRAPDLPPLEVARDRSRPIAQRAAAVAALADHGQGPDLLLDAVRELKAVPVLAEAIVDAVRRRPTPERLRELSRGAADRWSDWPEEARDDAAWVVVQGVARTPDLPGAEDGLIGALRSRDPEVRRLAAVELGERGTPRAIPALRRGEALIGGSARRAIDRIAARAGVGEGDLALAVDGGGLALADEGGRLAEADEA